MTYLCSCSTDKGFVTCIHIPQGDILFARGYLHFPSHLNYCLTGYSMEDVCSKGRIEHSIFNDKKIFSRSLCNKTLYIKKQSFIAIRSCGFLFCHNTVNICAHTFSAGIKTGRGKFPHSRSFHGYPRISKEGLPWMSEDYNSGIIVAIRSDSQTHATGNDRPYVGISEAVFTKGI